MPTSEIDYPSLVDEALRGILRRVLASVVAEGLSGEHHFFIVFDTTHEGVEMPTGLRRAYPEEMTIVLQHQFWDLVVDEDGFAVTLRFGGQPSRLGIPWAAVRSFVDPVAEFGLRFETETTGVQQEPEPEAPTSGRETGRVVSLEDFRKRDG